MHSRSEQAVSRNLDRKHRIPARIHCEKIVDIFARAVTDAEWQETDSYQIENDKDWKPLYKFPLY